MGSGAACPLVSRGTPRRASHWWAGYWILAAVRLVDELNKSTCTKKRFGTRARVLSPLSLETPGGDRNLRSWGRSKLLPELFRYKNTASNRQPLETPSNLLKAPEKRPSATTCFVGKRSGPKLTQTGSRKHAFYSPPAFTPIAHCRRGQGFKRECPSIQYQYSKRTTILVLVKRWHLAPGPVARRGSFG